MRSENSKAFEDFRKLYERREKVSRRGLGDRARFKQAKEGKDSSIYYWKISLFHMFGGLPMREIEDENDLVDILKRGERVFVLFYASWCRFSRAFFPIFEKYAMAKGYGKFLRFRINDEWDAVWEKYGVEEVPTVIVFNGLKVARRLRAVPGAGLSEKQFKDFLEA